MLRRNNFFFQKPCPNQFLKSMTQKGFTAFFGVPDSLLKELCTCITYHGAANKDNTNKSDTNNNDQKIDIDHHVIAANEGNAVGLAAGYYLSTSRVPVVYMQNSGLGNCVNPLTSLTHKDVYGIPMVMLVGWRGRPGAKKDEPQHVAMGRLTENCLDACEVPHCLLGTDGEKSVEEALMKAQKHVETEKTPFAILVDRETFSGTPDFVSQGLKKQQQKNAEENTENNKKSLPTMSREFAIEKLLTALPSSTPVVSTTGMPSREVFETRKRLGQSNDSDFLTVGAMGHNSSIAAGVVLGQSQKFPDRKVVCLDGDGAFLMHLGAAAILAGGGNSPASPCLKNLVHIVLNNGAHDSVGGQPTVGFDVDLTDVANSCGYQCLAPVTTEEQLDRTMLLMEQFINPGTTTKKENEKEGTSGIGSQELELVVEHFKKNTRPLFVEIRVKKGNRKDLGRPTSSAADNRAAFMKFVQ